MEDYLLEIIDLHVLRDQKMIIKGMNLKIKLGQTHVIMGPNGAGKSTLSYVLAGHPSYEIVEGKILLEGKDISDLLPEERANLGVFTGFQYPIEIKGISNEQFLYTAFNLQREKKGEIPKSQREFEKILDEKMKFMGIRKEFKNRNLNEGFSGGEKKKNEILQMSLLDPKFVLLDEIDSGLDIDSMKLISSEINNFKSNKNALLLITHYQRFLNYISPDFVHVMIDGKIVKTGNKDFVLELEEKGYEWLTESPKSSYE
jgi:Fe-S cluster assembly ATP-binding protein